MAKFTPHKIPFGRGPVADEDDDGHDLPRPHLLRLQARRAAGIAEAKSVLEHLPDPGESVHILFTARMDLSDACNAILERLGRCEQMRIATLGYSRKNLRTLLAWLDSGKVGSLTLLASIFFRSHNGELWTETQAEFRERKQRTACCHSHAKVISMAFSDGKRLAIEGSSNLCGSGSGREQLALINDPGIHDWHSHWIEALVSKHAD